MSEVRFRRILSFAGWFFSLLPRILGKLRLPGGLKIIVYLTVFISPTIYLGAKAGASSRSESRRWHTTPATVISKELVHSRDHPELAQMVFEYQIGDKPKVQATVALPWDISIGTQFSVWARSDGAMNTSIPPLDYFYFYHFLGLFAGLAIAILWAYGGSKVLEAIRSWPEAYRPRWFLKAHPSPSSS